MKKWVGTFSSNNPVVSLIVKGKITCEISKKSKSKDINFRMEFTGIYRYGDVITGTMKVNGDKMTVIIDGQKVDYQVEKRSKKEISGSYSCPSPYDCGTFYLTPSK